MESVECCFFFFSAAFMLGQPQCLLECTQQNVLSRLPWTNTGNVELNVLSGTLSHDCYTVSNNAILISTTPSPRHLVISILIAGSYVNSLCHWQLICFVDYMLPTPIDLEVVRNWVCKIGSISLWLSMLLTQYCLLNVWAIWSLI